MNTIIIKLVAIMHGPEASSKDVLVIEEVMKMTIKSLRLIKLHPPKKGLSTERRWKNFEHDLNSRSLNLERS